MSIWQRPLNIITVFTWKPHDSRKLVFRFTESEDETIREAIRQQRNRVNVAELAATLQRSYQAIEKRARLLKQPNSMSRKIKWQERNMATFVKYLLKVTRIKEENLTMLQHRTVTAEEWRKLSAKLDGYPPKSLKRVWFELIYPRLFIPVDLIDVRQVKMELIDLYVVSNWARLRGLQWIGLLQDGSEERNRLETIRLEPLRIAFSGTDQRQIVRSDAPIGRRFRAQSEMDQSKK